MSDVLSEVILNAEAKGRRVRQLEWKIGDIDRAIARINDKPVLLGRVKIEDNNGWGDIIREVEMTPETMIGALSKTKLIHERELAKLKSEIAEIENRIKGDEQ